MAMDKNILSRRAAANATKSCTDTIDKKTVNICDKCETMAKLSHRLVQPTCYTIIEKLVLSTRSNASTDSRERATVTADMTGNNGLLATARVLPQVTPDVHCATNDSDPWLSWRVGLPSAILSSPPHIRIREALPNFVYHPNQTNHDDLPAHKTNRQRWGGRCGVVAPLAVCEGVEF